MSESPQIHKSYQYPPGEGNRGDSRVRFDIVSSGAGYRLTAVLDKDGVRVSTLPAYYSTMAEAKLAWGVISECPQCATQALAGNVGPEHFGSKRCQSGSPASGGDSAHCSCAVCW